MTQTGIGHTLVNRQLEAKLAARTAISLVPLAGLALAVVTKRPEFVAVATPAIVVLSAWRDTKADAIKVGVRLTATRVFEGEQVAVEVTVAGSGESALEVVLHPSDGIEVVRGHDGGPRTR